MSFSIETIKEYSGRGFKCALFDFDGTISLIREGWQKVMIPYFCEVIEALGTNENKDGICEEVTEFVDRLTGKQTIFQCIALNEAVVRRGGEHVDPGEYKKEYLRRLETRIADRKNGLESGCLSPADLAVRGSVEFIKALRKAGIRCFLASGTDEEDVIYEASLIGVKNLFDGGIHGAKDADFPENTGIIIEAPGFLPNYSGMKNLEYLASIRGKIGKEQIESAMKTVGLDPSSKLRVGKYSLGMKQRLGIAQAIMEDQQLLILDEPMNALDKDAVEEMRKLFLSCKASGKTMLIVSHNEGDISTLCDEVYEFDGARIKRRENV